MNTPDVNTPDTILFRCDAGVSLGTGHVMRSLALAQACSDAGGRAAFLMRPGAPALEARLTAEGMAVRRQTEEPGSRADAEETIRAARAVAAGWVAADGYGFGTDYQQALKDAGVPLLLFDDYGPAGRYTADLIVNPSLGGVERLYRNRRPETRLLLGARYAPLRREFRARRDLVRDIPDRASRLLITLGGSDPENVTQRIVETLPHVAMDGLETVVVLGGSNPHRQALAEAVRRCPVPVRLEVNALDMPGLLAWADAAVSAGGSTCWEMAMLGLPALAFITAENQRRNVEEMARRGVLRALGTPDRLSDAALARKIMALLWSHKDRARMAARGRSLVDGEGAPRILSHLRRRAVRLRRAGGDDCRQVWEWANDPEVRSASFTSDPIPWDAHCVWFERRLRDPETALFLAFDLEDQPVGQVRFQGEGEDAVVSISIAGEQRGRGYGQAVLREALRLFRAGGPARAVRAYIKEDNAASQRLFEAAGFQRLTDTVCQGQNARCYVIRPYVICPEDAHEPG